MFLVFEGVLRDKIIWRRMGKVPWSISAGADDSDLHCQLPLFSELRVKKFLLTKNSSNLIHNFWTHHKRAISERSPTRQYRSPRAPRLRAPWFQIQFAPISERRLPAFRVVGQPPDVLCSKFENGMFFILFPLTLFVAWSFACLGN